MEECSFAPKLHKKKTNVARNIDTDQRKVKPNANKMSYQQQDFKNKSSSRANELTQDDELD